jgi:hypothetical protein
MHPVYELQDAYLKEWPVADETDVLFQEIEDDLRQDHANKFWSDFGKYIIGAAIALVVSVASFQGWKSYDLKQRQAAGEFFASAQKLISNKKSDEALKVFTEISGTDGGYSVLAKFRSAALMSESGDLNGAINKYRQLANDHKTTSHYREMAIVIGAFAELDAKDSNATLITKAASLNDSKNPWRHSAREILGLSAMKNGDKSMASVFFKAISEDATAPKEFKTRADEMLEIVIK